MKVYYLKCMIKVFFDGKCNLCAKEINYYRKIAPVGIFDWQDINTKSDELIKTGIKTSDALKVLHVINNNKLYKGIDAFIVIWTNLTYWNILGKFASIPIIKNILNLMYNVFANWRFNKLKHCIIAKENDNKL